MNELISVIVPAFNCEKTINRCIDSIIRQTYKNIEIIIINDGSKDNTDNVCKKIRNLDSRVKYISKDNKGVSNTRNYGIECSQGKYIMFVDSDDYIEDNYINTLYQELKNNNVSIVISGATRVSPNGKVESLQLYPNNNVTYEIKDIIDDVINTIYFSSACKMLFKKDILNNIRFNEKLVYGEDLYFTYNLIRNNKIFYSKNCGYYYVKNDKSATYNTDEKMLESYIDNNNFIFSSIEKEFPYKKVMIKNRLFTKLNLALIRYSKDRRISYKQFKILSTNLSKKIKIDGVNIKKINYESKINKIKMMLLYKEKYFAYFYLNRLILIFKNK